MRLRALFQGARDLFRFMTRLHVIGGDAAGAAPQIEAIEADHTPLSTYDAKRVLGGHRARDVGLLRRLVYRFGLIRLF